MSQGRSDARAPSPGLPPETPDDADSENTILGRKAVMDRGTLQDLRPVTAEDTPGEAKHRRAEDEKPSGTLGDLEARLNRLEKQNRRMKFAILGFLLLVGFLAFRQLVPSDVIIKQTLMESEEVKLVDKSGHTRFFLRMYSRVPVLQLLDSNGKPRMSMGLRFDDTPFLDLSDKTGRTRATFEMTAEDEPTLRLFDENGETTFKIK